MGSVSPAASPQTAGSSITDLVIQWASRHARLLAPFITLIALFAFFSWRTEVFLTTRNLQNVITQVAPIAVAATGVTFVLLCAEIDLSIASVATFSAMMAAWFWVGDPIHLGSWGILAGVLIGAGLGLINGIFIAYIGIPSFMMTLAMLTIAKGLTTYVNDGKPIFEEPDILRRISSAGNLFMGIPVIGIIAAIVLAIGHIILAYTRFGRHVYMTGGNREAAEMSGVDTKRVIMLVMTFCALTCGVAGMLLLGRVGQVGAESNPDLLINTIAAVVLGGTSLFGGEGGMLNTVLGLLIFAVLSNGLNLLPELSIYFKGALTGIILLAALLLNVVALRLENVQRRSD
ncbi:MAG: ABC transporter permease [Thermomicrobiales bacterium]|nr:ABC transporter permease [Thermomicrobiales bacterium]